MNAPQGEARSANLLGALGAGELHFAGLDVAAHFLAEAAVRARVLQQRAHLPDVRFVQLGLHHPPDNVNTSESNPSQCNSPDRNGAELNPP